MCFLIQDCFNLNLKEKRGAKESQFSHLTAKDQWIGNVGSVRWVSINYLGSVFKEKDTEMYYTDNEQKKNRFNTHKHTLMPNTQLAWKGERHSYTTAYSL